MGTIQRHEKAFSHPLAPEALNEVHVAISFAQEDQFFKTIQDAIDAVNAGTNVVIHPGTYTEQVTLKNGVNLVGSSTAPVIITSAAATQTLSDGGLACNVSLSNLTINNTGTGIGMRLTNGGTVITGAFVVCNSVASNGVRSDGATVYGVTGQGATGGGFYNNYGRAFVCVGTCTTANQVGFVNEGGTARWCDGISSGGVAAWGFYNRANGIASFCYGESDNLANFSAFRNFGAKAISCVAVGYSRAGFDNVSGDYTATVGYAIDCTGISLGALGGGISVGFNNGSTGGTVCFAKRCSGHALGGLLAGEGFNAYELSVSELCDGFSTGAEGMGFYGAIGISCTATTGPGVAFQAMSAFNSAVFGGIDLGSTLINCSAYSTAREALYIQSNLAQAGSKIYGGTFISTLNAANGNGCSISGTAPITSVHEIYNVTFRVTNAGAFSINAQSAVNVKYAGIIANTVVDAVDVTQAIVAVVDLQGNLFG